MKLDLLKEQFGDVTLDEATKVYTITFDDGGTAIVDDENQEVKCENQQNADKLRSVHTQPAGCLCSLGQSCICRHAFASEERYARAGCIGIF